MQQNRIRNSPTPSITYAHLRPVEERENKRFGVNRIKHLELYITDRPPRPFPVVPLFAADHMNSPSYIPQQGKRTNGRSGKTSRAPRMNTKYSFDPLCLELASHFLPDGASDKAKNDLAQVIQNAVEAHLLEEQISDLVVPLKVSLVSERSES